MDIEKYLTDIKSNRKTLSGTPGTIKMFITATFPGVLLTNKGI